jgi:hypothetical protein
MNHTNTPRRTALLLILLALVGLFAPVESAQADVGPKPSMDFAFVYETGQPLTIVEGQQMQCEEPDCADAEPLEELGPQGIRCTAEACSSMAYGYTTYNQLVIAFSDGITRTSDVFTSGTMRSNYRVTVREDDLQVERVGGGGAAWPFLWILLGGPVGTGGVILIGLLGLAGVAWLILGSRRNKDRD